MLLWAIFTLGYLFGVFFTLVVLMRKDVVEGVNAEDNANNLGNSHNISPWKLFTQLTKVNYPNAIISNEKTQTVEQAKDIRLASNSL